jgi:maleate isomerase
MRLTYKKPANTKLQRTTLGLVVLKADETVEADFRRLLPEGDLALHVTRVESGDDLTLETIGAMGDRLAGAAALFPGNTQFDCVGYACTSATSVLGIDDVHAMIASGCNTRAVSEPASALLDACRTLGISRLAFVSPYVAEVSAALRATLEAHGLAIARFGAFEEQSEAAVARIGRVDIIDAACILAGQGGCDAIFLSCTNLRTLDVIATIEDATGLPVLASNPLLAWHMMRLAGRVHGHGEDRFGRLFAAG